MARTGITKPLPGAQINRNHRLANGLIGCWNFNEGSGDRVYDAAGYGNGSLLGTTGKPTWQTGRDGKYLNFVSANNQYVQVAHNSAHSLSSNSGNDDLRDRVTWQIKFRLTTLRDYNGLFTKSTAAGVANPYDSYVLSTGALRITNNIGGAQTGFTFAAGVWYDMICVSKATSLGGYGWGLYLSDGSEMQLTSTHASTPDTDNPIRFGNRFDDATPLNGDIGYVRLWHRHLSSEERSAAFSQPFCFMSDVSPRRFYSAVVIAASPRRKPKPYLLGLPGEMS